MRNQNQEIVDRDGIDSIIRDSIVCRLGVVDGDTPYIVPMCFGYDGTSLYFHSANAGKKLELLRRNGNVCVEFETGVELEESTKACSFAMKYESVIVFGRALFLKDLEEKKDALNIIVAQYSDKTFKLPPKAVEHIAVLKVEIESITGRHG